MQTRTGQITKPNREERIPNTHLMVFQFFIPILRCCNKSTSVLAYEWHVLNEKFHTHIIGLKGGFYRAHVSEIKAERKNKTDRKWMCQSDTVCVQLIIDIIEIQILIDSVIGNWQMHTHSFTRSIQAIYFETCTMSFGQAFINWKISDCCIYAVCVLTLQFAQSMALTLIPKWERCWGVDGIYRKNKYVMLLKCQ